jgi:hypothetical protein
VFLLFINAAAHQKSDEGYATETTVVYLGYLKKLCPIAEHSMKNIVTI